MKTFVTYFILVCITKKIEFVESFVLLPIWTGWMETKSSCFFSSLKSNDNDNDNDNDNEKVINPLISTSTFTSKPYKNIPNEIIEEIKNKADIVSVIESYNLPQFVRTGPNKAKAICPFHDDTNPSLSIDGNRKIFKCFSCGKGGDVFHFVREYHHLTETSEKMSFVKSIQYVAEEFTDGSIYDFTQSNKNMTQAQFKKHQETQYAKHRILLANTAAAEFYGKNLMTLPSAGLARRHLQSRGLSPKTIRTFAIGYAPDAYFNPIKSTNKSKQSQSFQRGQGSLVYRLKELGFSPKEIFDAGLATVSKHKYHVQTSNHTNQTDFDNTSSDPYQYDTLIDRFRGRLIVPIFDNDGKHILAFGGRHLNIPTSSESESESKSKSISSYKPPKYLNSPESSVFIKQKILFGLHQATKNIKSKDNDDLTQDNDDDLQAILSNIQQSKAYEHKYIIVEGYFDAIALHDAGIKHVTASMGTALSKHQLELIFKIPNMKSNGSIILCLDNDDAGLNAVERFCDNTALTKLAEEYGINIYVGTLPENIKDPAEFIQSRGGGLKAGKAFQDEVIDNATSWSDWYINRIISEYDPNSKQTGSKGTFSSVCNRVSDFLSTFTNAADRTKRTYEVASKLSDLITTTDGSSAALQIQLESDLLDMSSRKARLRENISRRIESVDDHPQQDRTDSNIIAKLTSGEGVSGTKHNYDQEIDDSIPSVSKETAKNIQTTKRQPKYYKTKTLKSYTEPSIVPHFSGVVFQNPEDAEWLGLDLDKSKWKRSDVVFGKPAYSNHYRKNPYGKTQNDIVFFNSNEYLGASSYSAIVGTNSKSSHGESQNKILDYTSSALQQNTDKIIEGAESRLLRALVIFKSARDAMKAAVHANMKTQDSEIDKEEKLLEWSSFDREWLFDKLIGLGSVQNDNVSKKIQHIECGTELKRYLSALPDVPSGAFGAMKNQSQIQNITNHISPIIEDFSNDFDSHDHIPMDSDEIDNYASSYDPSEFDEDEIINTIQSNNPNLNHFEALTSDEKQNKNNHQHKQDIPFGSGSLDKFFSNQRDQFQDQIDREHLAELTVQETVSIMLRASAIKRRKSLSKLWLAANEELSKRPKEKNDETKQVRSSMSLQEQNLDTKDMKSIENGYESLDTLELKQICEDLGKELTDASKAVVELDASARRMGKRLLEFCAYNFQQKNKAKQEALKKELDETLANLPSHARQPDSPGDDGNYIFGSDSFDEQFNPMLGGKSKRNTRTSGQAPITTNPNGQGIFCAPIGTTVIPSNQINIDIHNSGDDSSLSALTNIEVTFEDNANNENLVQQKQSLKDDEYYSAEIEGFFFENVFNVT